MLWKTSFGFIWDILNFLKVCKSWVWAQIRRSKLLLWGWILFQNYFFNVMFRETPCIKWCVFQIKFNVFLKVVFLSINYSDVLFKKKVLQIHQSSKEKFDELLLVVFNQLNIMICFQNMVFDFHKKKIFFHKTLNMVHRDG